MAFSFSFGGDDIEEDHSSVPEPRPDKARVPSGGPSSAPAASAFPVQGKPQLPPLRHDLDSLLSRLPSKIAYSLLKLDLDDGSSISLPRRELWDVRVQLMAEEGNGVDASESETGLGSHDVKTGIYEGGFKSWESSVDLVKVLGADAAARVWSDHPSVLIEVGIYLPLLPPLRVTDPVRLTENSICS